MGLSTFRYGHGGIQYGRWQLRQLPRHTAGNGIGTGATQTFTLGAVYMSITTFLTRLHWARLKARLQHTGTLI
jgi:hypothetical protein